MANILVKRDIENKIIAGRELKTQLDAQLSECEERIKDIKADQKYTYYFGSAWSEYDVRNQDEWQVRIDGFLNALDMPLVVTVE